MRICTHSNRREHYMAGSKTEQGLEEICKGTEASSTTSLSTLADTKGKDRGIIQEDI